MPQTDYDAECHQQRMQTWPPRVNRKHFATEQTFWIDSMGERHMTALTGSTQVLVWLQVNGADRFVVDREAKR